jgi:hypothetical protein
MRHAFGSLVLNPEGRKHLEILGLDGRIILI